MQNCKKQWKKCKKIDVKMRENDCDIKKCKKVTTKNCVYYTKKWRIV